MKPRPIADVQALSFFDERHGSIGVNDQVSALPSAQLLHDIFGIMKTVDSGQEHIGFGMTLYEAGVSAGELVQVVARLI
ncbi:MAG: hypothetical protein D4S02_17675 [Rhodocyclaceae bacterium]|nr:MAG: hypothetical protein D4S02_17675 [Rhodocyclaceae bacterium]